MWSSTTPASFQWEERRRGELQRTFGNARDGLGLVAVGLLEGEQDVDLGPVGEHLLDDWGLVAVLLLELRDDALVFVERARVIDAIGLGLGAVCPSA